MELAHLPYKKGTYEDYVGERGLEKRGKKKWRHHVADVVERLIAALEPDDVVLGGGNVKKLKELPKGCREREQRQCVPGRVSPVGESGRSATFPRAQEPGTRRSRKNRQVTVEEGSPRRHERSRRKKS